MADKKHICNQGDRVLTLEINEANMAKEISEVKLKIDKNEEKSELRHEEIKKIITDMVEAVDKKYVKKETFTVAIAVVSGMALIIGLVTYFVNK